MKVVIDLPEEDFGWNGKLNICRCSFERLIQIVSDGKPLPDHGDLIDRDKLVPCCKFRGDCWADKCDSCSDYAVDYSDIKNATPIIGAEGRDSE